MGILGCGGRMGRMLLATVAAQEGALIAGGVDRADSTLIGADLGDLAGIGALGLTASSDKAALFAASDVVIDFTLAEATVEHAGLAAQSGTALVVGTTGLGEVQLAALESAAEAACIVRAANTSLGMTLLLAVVEQVARALDEDYDIEIVEMHHRHKVDAPSGTALALGEAAAAGRNVDLDSASVRVRDGHTGPRQRGTIGFATLRGGDVTGEHSVIFAGTGERVEITHKASSRQVFAEGAVRAARWTFGKPPGLYGMRDVLGI